MRPKGILIAIGGNEERDFRADERFNPDFREGAILNSILDYAGGKRARIEVVTTASSIPEEVGKSYCKAFAALEADNVGILHLRESADADTEEVLRRIEVAAAVMFSGGDQSRLSGVLCETSFYRKLRERFLNEKFVVAGTSAGAMVMSEEMITGGGHQNVLLRDGLKMGRGLGLMDSIIFDTHFIHRGRFGRLAEAVALHPDKLGVGLGEDTAMIITEGNECRVIGSGMVILFEGRKFSYNQCALLKAGTPISLGHLIVHILAPNDKYFINEKRIEVYHDPSLYHQNH